MADKPTTRIGVIGLGLIAQVAHLPALAKLRDRATVTHLADVAPGLARRIADQTPGEPVATEDWTTMLDDRDSGEDRPDAVVICTPGDHARIAQRCLEAGVSVLAEKPLALTVAEATELAELAASKGLVLDVAYMKTHDRVVHLAADLVREFNAPRLARVTVLHPADEPQVAHVSLVHGDGELSAAGRAEIDESIRYSNEAAQRAVGDDERIVAVYRDILSGSVVHELSLLRAVLDSTPTWANATLSPNEGGPPCIHASGRIADGLQLSLDWLWLPTFPDYEEQLSIFAADARLTLSMEPPYNGRRTVCRVDRLRTETYRSHDELVGEYDSSFDAQMADFLDAVASGTPANSGHDAARDIASLQQLAKCIADDAGWACTTEVGGP